MKIPENEIPAFLLSLFPSVGKQRREPGIEKQRPPKLGKCPSVCWGRSHQPDRQKWEGPARHRPPCYLVGWLAAWQQR